MKSKNAKSYGSHCRRTSVCRTGVHLPEEIIMEILPRVPAKTLGRCKCVSKHWRDLISDPKFVKIHLSLNNRRAKALLVDDRKPGPFFVVDFDGEAGGSSGEVTATRLKLDRVDDDMQCGTVYCSYNGLVLILGLHLRFFFLNPTTLECKELPKPPVNPFNFDVLHLELAYDSTADDYKAVVIFYPNEVCVYSFKTNAWKWLQDSPFYYLYLPKLCHQPAVFLNGSFHWFGETLMSYLNKSFLFQIIAFDLADETYRVVPVPSKFDVLEDEVSHLGVVSGSLCIICQENGSHVNGRVDVWVMNEYGVKESWTKISFYQDIAKVNRVWFLGNDEFMLISSKTWAVIYNVKEKSSRHIVLPELKGHIRCNFSDSLVSYKQLL